jgi:hypothetical protein
MAYKKFTASETVLKPDPRFNRQVDKDTGYRTCNILAVPMRYATGEVTGVLQALNKVGGRAFTEEDEELASALGAHAAAAIENAIILQRSELLGKDKERNVNELPFSMKFPTPCTLPSNWSSYCALSSFLLPWEIPRFRPRPLESHLRRESPPRFLPGRAGPARGSAARGACSAAGH